MCGRCKWRTKIIIKEYKLRIVVLASFNCLVSFLFFFSSFFFLFVFLSVNDSCLVWSLLFSLFAF